MRIFPHDGLRCLPLFLALTIVVGTPAASAQMRFEVQRFHPAASQTQAFFAVQSTRLVEPGRWEFSVLGHHGQNPLVFEDASGRNLGRVVRSQGVTNILAAYGVLPYVQLGVDIPVVVYQTGGELPTLIAPGETDNAGIGDLRLVPTVALPAFDVPGGQIGVAFVVDMALPTGQEESFQGGGFRIQPKVAAEYATSVGYNLAINVGYAVRDDAELLYLNVDDSFTWGVAVQVPMRAIFRKTESAFVKELSFLTEINGEVAFLGGSVESEEVPLELLAGFRSGLGPVSFQAAVGAGLTDGFGTPDWRLVLGVAYRGGRQRDPDGDGLIGSADQCPDRAEDIDLFSDEDGCPDLDNDGDGIVDLLDNCPSMAEDENGYEDGDGCPDEHLKNARARAGSGDGSAPAKVTAGPVFMQSVDGTNTFEGCTTNAKGQLTCPGKPIVDNLVVYFATDTTDYRPESINTLRQIARLLSTHPKVDHVWIEGHADDRDSGDYNLALSYKRAEEIREFLMKAGVSSKRLSVTGWSDRQKITTQDNEVAHAMNKRVEFRIAPKTNTRGLERKL